MALDHWLGRAALVKQTATLTTARHQVLQRLLDTARLIVPLAHLLKILLLVDLVERPTHVENVRMDRPPWPKCPS